MLLKTAVAWLLENKLGKWSSPAWIVEDVFDDTNNLSRLLGSCEWHELSSTFPVVGVGTENITITFTLSADNMTHRKKGMAKPK